MITLLHTLAASFPFDGLLAQVHLLALSRSVIIGWNLVGIVLPVAGLWRVFVKAGRPGWAAAVPFYNVGVILKIVGAPARWNLLMLIPVYGFYIFILAMIALARSFGKGTGFGVGCALLMFIFLPILGFGGAKYVGPRPA